MSMESRELLPVASGAQTRRATLALLRPQLPIALLAVVALLATAGLGLVAPIALGRIVDAVVDERGAGAVTGPVVVLVLAALAAGLTDAAANALVARATEPALATLRERVVAKALHLPLEAAERAGAGDIVARVSGDVAQVAEALRNVLPAISISGLTIGLTVVGLGALDWRFAVAGLCAVPIQALALRWYLRDSSPVYRAERIAGGRRAQQLLDSISGADTVRAFGLSARHLEQVGETSTGAMRYVFAATRLRTYFFGRLNAAEFVGLSAILVMGFFLVRDGAVTVGETTAAMLFFTRLFDPINIVLFLVDDAQQAAAGLSRLVGVAEAPLPDGTGEPGTRRDGTIELSGVRYAYVPGHEVVRDISLRVEAGECVALVGASGAGKTTLAKLIAGIHQPTDGQICVGAGPPAGAAPGAERTMVALVTQEIHVFAGTLAEDLRLARPDATDAELVEAMEVVGAAGWLATLPDGLATVVGDGGYRLTPLQVQQLALARVLLLDPPIVILDEATAEAGSAGAQVLEASARRVLRDRTGIVVAHRLGQAATADRIVVMEDGAIVEMGSHAELAGAGGIYARLWTAWANR